MRIYILQSHSSTKIQSPLKCNADFCTSPELCLHCIAMFLPWSQRNFVNHLIFRIRSHPLTSIQMVVPQIKDEIEEKIWMHSYASFSVVLSNKQLTGVNLFNDSQIDFVCIVLTFFIHFLHKPLTKREKLLHSLLTKCKMQNFSNFRNG